jgi:hypothetical protein
MNNLDYYNREMEQNAQAGGLRWVKIFKSRYPLVA